MFPCLLHITIVFFYLYIYSASNSVDVVLASVVVVLASVVVVLASVDVVLASVVLASVVVVVVRASVAVVLASVLLFCYHSAALMASAHSDRTHY